MRKLIFVLLAFILSSRLSAQLTLSPYSRYGLGEMTEANSVRNLSMGGISAGVYDWSSINHLNPASYADLRITTLDVSGYSGLRMQKTSLNSHNALDGGFQQLSFGFSNNKKFGIVAGLAPSTAVGYDLQFRDSVATDTSVEGYTQRIIGAGGVNQFYIGAGVRFLRNFRAGVNLCYNFGNTSYRWQNDFDNSTYNVSNILSRTSVRGFIPQAGLLLGDTLEFQKTVNRTKYIQSQLESENGQVASLTKDITALEKSAAAARAKSAKTRPKAETLRAEKASMEQEVSRLMKENEDANEKRIGKLQDRAFRVERKIRKIENTNRAREKNADAELDRARVERKRIEDKIKGLNRQQEDIAAGKLSDTVRTKKSVILRVGGMAQPANSFKGEKYLYYNSMSSGGSSVSDSIVVDTNGRVTMPMRISGGFSLSSPFKWMVGADIIYQDWSTFNFFGDNPGFTKSMRISVGGEWIPNYIDNKFHKRIAYRIGGFYHASYLVLNGQQIKEYGVTAGVGLPLGRMVRETGTFSRLNLGLQLVQNGTAEAGLVRDLSVRLQVGLTLNELWFRRWRIE